MSGGTEKIIHRTRSIVEQHWSDKDFVVMKVDFRNAFNSVSRQVIFDECNKNFPELIPYLKVCYGQHPFLFHHMGILSSSTGVQQGDPLGPFLFSVALHKLVLRISERVPSLLLHAWYLDDGIFCGSSEDVLVVLKMIEDSASWLGLTINYRKCELFSLSSLKDFPNDIPTSGCPHFEVLGAPIGNEEFCISYIQKRIQKANQLLKVLPKLEDPQVALLLLRSCGSFCKLAHIARNTPSSVAMDSLGEFDACIRQCLEESAGLQLTESAWSQAQLGMRYGGLGLRSLSRHSTACYISSFISSTSSLPCDTSHLEEAITSYNQSVSTDKHLSVQKLFEDHPTQAPLSSAIEEAHFQKLRNILTPAQQIRLDAVAGPNTSHWLRATPSPGLSLHLEPNEMQVLLKMWLGLDLFPPGSTCPTCPTTRQTALDQPGHHALTCKYGYGVVHRHNILRDTLLNFCQRSHLSPQLEQGGSQGGDQRRPADILLPSWSLGKDAALDLTVVHPLNYENFQLASTTVESVTAAAEERKMETNGAKCASLNWKVIPMVVTTYGTWGKVAIQHIGRISNRLAIKTQQKVRDARNEMLCRLSLVLQRTNARSLLLRSHFLVS